MTADAADGPTSATGTAADALVAALETVRVRRSRFALAGLMLVAGVMHFVTPKTFDELIPGWLGNKRAWTLGSGAAELVVGTMLLVPRTRRLGAWAALALLVIVFPGNIKMAVDAGSPTDLASLGPWLRLPIQIPLWRWAYRHTYD